MLKGNEKGQSLIEVLVVGVVSAIMILALIMIILNSLKNAQFAQNQTQATKLAQNTIDIIRSLRDGNHVNTISNGGSSYCFIELWNQSTFSCSSIGSYCYYFLSTTSLDFQNSDNPSSSESLANGFSRQIKVHQNMVGTEINEANVTVTINWSDSSGSHSSQLETVITKPNYDCSN